MATLSRHSGIDRIREVERSVKCRMAHLPAGLVGLAAGSPSSYQGLIAEPHQALGNASGRYIMKARLFTLALAVAPLAALIGAYRSGR
jgi:hypothetical protein